MLAVALVLASGKELAGGLSAVFLGLGVGGVVVVYAAYRTLNLLLRRGRLDAAQRRVLHRWSGFWVLLALVCCGVWIGLGARLAGDELMLLPAAGVAAIVGVLALRRAGRAGR